MMRLIAILTVFFSLTASCFAKDFDVVIYGGTAGGIAAAVQASRMGKHVALIEPIGHLGGVSSAGLGFTDAGDTKTVGGISHEFYHRVWQAYQKQENWPHETRESFSRKPGQSGKSIDDADQVQWLFEPHIAERVFDEMAAEANVEVFKARLDLKNGVTIADRKITAIRMENGDMFSAKVFLDCSYEGDLMAKAGVAFVVGREANSQYGETINGIQSAKAKKNQLPIGIDPFNIEGDSASGLLAGVNASAGGADGAADTRIQAYCYRLCMTNVPENRISLEKPAGYDAKDYEILFRAMEAGQKDRFMSYSRMVPNQKSDSNNDSGISTDYIGMNYDYPNADYATRDKIAAAHEKWQRGLIYTLQHDARVPESVRKQNANWGLAKDEFTDNGNWPRLLYIREARRMLGRLVETEVTLSNDSEIKDSIGLGSYAMDSHNVQRIVDSTGHVKNEGDVQIRPAHPYKISYRAIVPKPEQCTNLLVPVCLSASHIAYGSIRMEPVFMITGQSAATAACLAIDENKSVQDVDYSALSARLIADHQRLSVEAEAEANQSDVVCFGDSITHRGYPEVLGKLLKTTITNAGVDGNSTQMALERMDRDVLAHHPKVVVILFGTNDSRIDSPNAYVPIDQYAKNLTEMITACQKQNAKVFICTLPPIDSDKYFTRHKKATFDARGGLPKIIDQYRDAAVKAAKSCNAETIDLNTELAQSTDWRSDDGVHPTPAGNETIAKLISDKVAPLLSGKP